MPITVAQRRSDLAAAPPQHPASLPLAICGLLCVCLFSLLNNAQKTSSLPASCTWLAGPLGLLATIILLAGFAVCARYSVPKRIAAVPDAAVSPVRPAPTRPTAGPMPASKSYDPLLTLRAFACMMVLVGHAMSFAVLTPVLTPRIAANSPVWLLTASPEAGVWIFFTLSGYLIGKGFVTGRYRPSCVSIGKFYRNRVLRIVPLYWGTLTVFSAIVIPAIFAPRNLPAFVNMLCFNLDGLLPYMPIGALWSISTEMQFYLAAPLIFILLQRFATQPRGAGLTVLALSLSAIAWRGHALEAGGLAAWYRHAYAPLFINLDLFVIGMVTSWKVQRRRAAGGVSTHGLACGAAAIAVLYAADTWLRGYGVLVQTPPVTRLFALASPTLTALLTATAIFWLETAPKYRAPSRIYRLWHPTETIGVLTYGAYSLHEPVFLAYKHHAPAPHGIAAAAAISLCLIILVFGLAAVPYRLIERPFDRLKDY